MINAGGEETFGDPQIGTRGIVDICQDDDGQSKKKNCGSGGDPN